MAFTFPDIDPVALSLGPVQIRWYALAYIVGLFAGLKYAEILLRNALKKGANLLVKPEHIEDLFLYVALGVILGGRAGYVLFYKPAFYLENPGEIVKLWQGGMAFHGGALGVLIAVALYGHLKKIPILQIADVITPAVPIGLFFGRIANFLNAELYGRVTDVAWAVRFPAPYLPGGYTEPRHPSQLYEAFFEGAVLFAILRYMTLKSGAFDRSGKIAGVFFIGYAIARIICEFFREPDAFLGFPVQIGQGGLTQGMLLSLPMLILGAYLYSRAAHTRKGGGNQTA